MKILSNNEIKNILLKHNVSQLSSDSRHIDENTAFFAIKGAKYDGNDFIEESLRQNVACIFTENKNIAQKFVNSGNIYYVENAREYLALSASSLYPMAPENLLAITGTNGKSSIVHYIAQILSLLGEKSATIGTLGINIYENSKNQKITETTLTTIDPINYHKNLSDLAHKNINYCAIEASSIGLEQYRLLGKNFKVAGFSSFSQDHLDYHGNMKEYLNSKLKLFEKYQDESSIAVINSDIKEFEIIKTRLEEIGRKYITVGKNGDYKFHITEYSAEGTKFIISDRENSYLAWVDIIGEFQIANIVLSAVMLSCLGFSMENIVSCIPNLTSPEGRLEKIDKSNIFIDYAHSPDSLEKALIEVRKLAKKNSGNLILVFGCGGDRDKTKRPLMGDIAAALADIVIITDDNPRLEYPAKIREEIKQACPNAVEIGDRREAIKYAISAMKKNDIILVAGKGHENYQIIGENKTYFSDKDVVLQFLQKKVNGGR